MHIDEHGKFSDASKYGAEIRMNYNKAHEQVFLSKCVGKIFS